MHRRALLATIGGLAGGTIAGCARGGDGGSPGGDGPDGADGTGPPATLGREPSIASPAFDDGEPIPARFTCEGEDVSPALSVGGAPDGANALALLVDDPDAPGGTFTHWLLWGLDPSTRSIPEAVPRGGTVESPGGALQGTNDADVVGYSGPCPPPDDGAHGYRFRLFALAEALALEPGADRSAFDDALAGTTRSEAVLRGTYDR